MKFHLHQVNWPYCEIHDTFPGVWKLLTFRINSLKFSDIKWHNQGNLIVLLQDSKSQIFSSHRTFPFLFLSLSFSFLSFIWIILQDSHAFLKRKRGLNQYWLLPTLYPPACSQAPGYLFAFLKWSRLESMHVHL